MGCDISGPYLEQLRHGKWVLCAKLRVGRDYSLFAIMAGVHKYDEDNLRHFEPRGVPSDISDDTCDDYTYVVVDGVESDDVVPSAEAAMWVARGATIWSTRSNGDPRTIVDPDAHSASWLTTDEVAAVCEQLETIGNGHPDNGRSLKQMSGLLAMMRSLETPAAPCRIVYWFDN